MRGIELCLQMASKEFPWRRKAPSCHIEPVSVCCSVSTPPAWQQLIGKDGGWEKGISLSFMWLIGPNCKLLYPALWLSQSDPKVWQAGPAQRCSIFLCSLLGGRPWPIATLAAFCLDNVNSWTPRTQTHLTCLLMFLFNRAVGTCENYCTCDADCGWALGLVHVQGTPDLLLKDIYLVWVSTVTPRVQNVSVTMGKNSLMCLG